MGGEGAGPEKLGFDGALAELSTAVLAGSTDLSELAEEVLRLAIEWTGSSEGFVSEVDPAGALETMHAVRTSHARYAGHPGVFRRPDAGWANLRGWALEHRTGVLTNDPPSHPSYGGAPDGPPFACFLAVPALSGEVLLGQVAVANAPGGYDDVHLELLSRLGRVYAVAILRWRDLQALRRSEECYRTIFETAVCMITSVGRDGIIIDCNPRSVEVVGYEPAELVGQPLSSIIHPDDLGRAGEALGEILHSGRSFDNRYGCGSAIERASKAGLASLMLSAALRPRTPA